MGEYDSQYNVCPHCGFARGTAAAEPHHMQPETILHKKYIVGKVLGFGGFGVTYIGWDAMLNTKVAIKEYLPSEFATRIPGHTEVSVYEGQSRGFFDSGLHSFIEEAQRLAKFSSDDGIVRIYDTFTENNTAYIVMEYLDGETIASKLKRNGPMPYEVAMQVIGPVLTTLSKVHQIGIIHRDISPDNILVTSDGKVKILDFGSARYATAYNSKSLSVIVKRGYAPPEQYIKNAPQGPWSDNYAVAATLYKMLTGETPVESIDRKDVALVPPANRGVNIPVPCQNALMNALNLNPQNRPQTAEQFLSGLISGQAVIKEEKEKDKSKFPVWLKALIGVVAALVVIVGLLFATGTLEIVSGRLVFNNPFSQGDYVNVPDVLKKTKEEAEDILEEKDLNLLVVGKKAFEEDIEKDLICEQTPEGGNQLEKNGTVEVKISGGPAVGYVPPAVFYTQDAATNNFEAEGLRVNVTEEYSDTVGEGGVISQGTAAGTEMNKNSEVDLVVSKGPETRPTGTVTIGDLRGKDFETARRELLSQGVYLLIKEAKYDNNAAENSIMSQQTAAGTTVNKGSNVYVVISLGKEKVRVPDLEYLTEEEAKDALEELGLVAQVVDGYAENVEAGLVIDQSERKGAQVLKGSTVQITVNTGYETQGTTAEVITTETTTETTTEVQTGTLTGKVVDKASNAAMAGVTVKVVKAGTSEVVKSVTTNASGNYSVEIEAGEYIIKLTKADYNDTSVNVTVTPGQLTTATVAKMEKTETTGKLNGSVVDSATNAALSGVTIKVVKAGTSTVVQTITTNGSGNYSFEADAGNYVLKMSKSGYNDLNMSVTVQAGKTISAAKAKMVKVSAPASPVSGKITNAIDGQPVSGATIKVRAGSNATSGSYLNYSTTTNSTGNFTLNLPAGSYTLEISKSGFIKDYINVSPAGEAITNANTAISPVVETGNMRIVLTWGASPNDLDSHLRYDGGHVYYSSKTGYLNGETAAKLDVDDTSAYGPETTTIYLPNATDYEYSVYNYSGSPSITTSEAKVVVYSGNTIVGTYHVPTTGSGYTWNVLRIVDGQVIPVNTIS